MNFEFSYRKHLSIFALLFLPLLSFAQYSENSVLAIGQWVKIGVLKSGIYKIDANALRGIGWDLNSINPTKLQLYGNGGAMLPQANNQVRMDDLSENAILVQGEADGKFDNEDFVLFYGQSSTNWSYNAATQVFDAEKNIYADTTFYFLTYNQSSGKRIQTQSNLNGATKTIDTYDEYQLHENDLNNILKSGRKWYGELFSYGNELNLNFDVSGIVPTIPIKIASSVMARDTKVTEFGLSIGSQNIGNQSITSVSGATYDYKGVDRTDVFTFTPSSVSNNLALKINYSQNNSSGVGYLDKIVLNFKKSLKLYGNQTQFRSIESINQAITNFSIAETNSNLQIWDITNPIQVLNQSYQLNGTNAVFGANTNILKEFIAFSGNNFEAPITIQKINNQNLHALTVPNLVIITPTAFLSEANRLANFRRNHDNLTVEVVTTTQVFNEFASGKQDVSAIRDFMRMLYQKGNTKLKYLLLFGDASFDYKNRINGNTNFIPVYESRQSLHPIYSYSSDDYFGFLEANEGDWNEPSGDHTLEIGIGRLPIKNIQEARRVVDKLIYYASNPKTIGEWKNQVTFVADDGDSNTHQAHADELAEKVENEAKNYLTQKLFMDAFNQESTASGELVPELNTSINQAVENGVLILNFTGHGGESGWTEEKILDIPQIKNWRNLNNLPLFVTATCEFGRYDDPYQVSGAEEVLLNPNGGGIGLLTTTRPVFASTNLIINRAFYNAVFRKENNAMPRLGDVIKNTKNNSLNGSINRNFALLGDPSMKLAYPQKKVVVQKINGKALTTQADTLKSLQKITLSGEIQDNNTNILTDFNGTVAVNVFDKRQTENTKGTSAPVMQYKIRNISLFKGTASVVNGKFEISFVVPKDIQYNFDKGRINFYAFNDAQTIDANGVLENIFIGGSANVLADNIPPQMQVFMDNEKFVSGGKVEPNASLLVKLNDDNGINVSDAGLGHEILATLDENIDETINLNQFYQADKDSYKSGKVIYPFQNLAEGKHTLKVKAWDTHNNSVAQSIEFFVAKNTQVVLSNVSNFPNPVLNETTFRFSHNKVGQSLKIDIEIFSLSGAIIRNLQTETNFSDAQIEINWNGLDKNGNRLKNGIYFYRIKADAINDQAQGIITKKMIIIN